MDENFTDHPKVQRLSNEAFRLYVSGLCYANRFLTDGRVGCLLVEMLAVTALHRVPPAALGMPTAKSLAAELVSAGLWDVAIQPGDFVIHDFNNYQPTREEYEKRQREISSKRSVAGRRGAAARWQNEIPLSPEPPSTQTLPWQNGKPDDKTIARPVPSPSTKSSLLRNDEASTEENVDASRPSRFVAPTKKEISDYAVSKGWTKADWSTIAFFEFYGSKGWVVGKSPMKDWRLAACRAHRESWTVKPKNGEQRVVIHKNQRDLDTEGEAEQIQKNRDASTRRREAEIEDDRILNEVLEEKRKKQTETKH
jgi:hypothetical protein